MPGPGPSRSLPRLTLAVLFVVAAVAAALASPAASDAAHKRWTGSVNLYRPGVFTTQRSWLWCTAADVQIMRNIADHATDHTKANQQRYFRYMRARNRYDIPVRDGVDPAGWAAGLRHYVDARYRLTTNRSFDAALRSAVTNLRRTGLPVGITVAHGNHAWVLTGFSATADPATTRDFRVTSVRVVGPLWGLQSRSYGYDMRPNRTLTPRQLKGFFTPWHYAGVRMAWEGRWVSIQPVARQAAAAASPAPSPSRTPATPTPTVAPTATPTTSPALDPTAGPSPVAVARAEPPMSAGASRPPDPAALTTTADLDVIPVIQVLLLGAVLVLVGGGWWRSRRRR